MTFIKCISVRIGPVLSCVSAPVLPYLVLFLSLFSLIISWFPAPVFPSLSCVYKPQSVQLVFVGSTCFLRVLLKLLLWLFPVFPWLKTVKHFLVPPACSLSSVTWQKTRPKTVTSVCLPSIFVSRFLSVFLFLLCSLHGCHSSPRVPPPPAGAGGQISRGPYETVPALSKHHQLPGRRALCVLRRQS